MISSFVLALLDSSISAVTAAPPSSAGVRGELAGDDAARLSVLDKRRAERGGRGGVGCDAELGWSFEGCGKEGMLANGGYTGTASELSVCDESLDTEWRGLGLWVTCGRLLSFGESFKSVGARESRDIRLEPQEGTVWWP